jgi:hypothetical protein
VENTLRVLCQSTEIAPEALKMQRFTPLYLVFTRSLLSIGTDSAHQIRAARNDRCTSMVRDPTRVFPRVASNGVKQK